MSAVVQAQGFRTSCIKCNRFVQVKICPRCIAGEFVSWIMNYPDIEVASLKQVNKFLLLYEGYLGKSSTCGECYEKNAYLCTDCLSNFLLKIIAEAGANDSTLRSFRETFVFWRNEDEDLFLKGERNNLKNTC